MGPRHQPRRRGTDHPRDRILLYGVHAVEAALANPARRIHALRGTENALRRVGQAIQHRGLDATPCPPQALDALVGADTVHQGLVLEAEPLATPDLETLAGARLVVVLDQVSDPQNVGAVLRSAAAFGADALVMTARHSPPLSGTVAKAASGALEHVPVVLVPNLARALKQLRKFGFECIGLDGGAHLALEEQTPSWPVALVLGAEGKGLRRLTREQCDLLCRLNTPGPIPSLNVSNAAAVALHTLTTGLAAPRDQ